MSKIKLQVDDLLMVYKDRGGLLQAAGPSVRAVDHLSFELMTGEILGVAGESGCGKSTLVRGMLQLVPPVSGSVRLDGEEIVGLKGRALKAVWRRMQLVFQDPFASLDERMRVLSIIAEPLINFGLTSRRSARERARELMLQVGLASEQAMSFPHELSGGQRQRVGIARALAVQPDILFCDEPVSALDVSIQAQIIGLLRTLRRDLSLTILFISHDLSVLRYLCDRVLVMYRGRLVECATADALFGKPFHPYTRTLLDAAPVPDPGQQRHRKSVAVPIEVATGKESEKGCAFAPRCPRRQARCLISAPPETEVDGRRVACFYPGCEPEFNESGIEEGK